MNLEKKQQAKNLFFQTDLTKSQIAELLSISRRSLTYWIKEGNWNRLKKSATHLPSILAENCYHLIGHLTEYYLSERRVTNPVSNKDADTLYKLAGTIGKLKNRSTLNESMEMFGFFLEGLRKRNPKMAEDIMPYVDEYMSGRADIYAANLLPENCTGIAGRIPWIEEDKTEQQLDAREEFFSDPEIIEAYAAAGLELPDEETINTLPPDKELPKCTPNSNEERRENLKKFIAQERSWDE